MYKFMTILAIVAALFVTGIYLMYERQSEQALANARKPAPSGPETSRSDGDERRRSTSADIDEDVEKQLIKGFRVAAQRWNEKTPLKLDKQTRLDRVTVGPGARITYHSTLLADVRKVDATWARENLKPTVTRRVCSTPGMKESLQYGGVYAYAYTTRDSSELPTFEIDREDCGYEKKVPE